MRTRGEEPASRVANATEMLSPGSRRRALAVALVGLAGVAVAGGSWSATAQTAGLPIGPSTTTTTARSSTTSSTTTTTAPTATSTTSTTEPGNPLQLGPGPTTTTTIDPSSPPPPDGGGGYDPEAPPASP